MIETRPTPSELILKAMPLSETMVDIRPLRQIDPQRDSVLQRITIERFIPRAGGVIPRVNGSSRANPDRSDEDKRRDRKESSQRKLAFKKMVAQEYIDEVLFH